MTDSQPFLLDRANAWLLGSPPRRVPLQTRVIQAIESLFFPASIVVAGVLMSDPSQGFDPTPGRIVGVLLVASCTTACAVLSLKIHWKKYRREIGLLRTGRVIFGEVLSCKFEHAEGDEWTEDTATLEYAFVTPAGVRLTGKIVRVYGNWELPKWPAPLAGDDVAVLYLDDEKYRVL